MTAPSTLYIIKRDDPYELQNKNKNENEEEELAEDQKYAVQGAIPVAYLANLEEPSR
jgi:hypothetical protein